MRKILRSIIPGLSLLLLISSGCQSVPDIPDFDEAAFRQDARGCEGTRNSMKEKIFNIKDEFRGLSQRQVMQLLGKPERHELASRGQKSFVYYIEPSPECMQNNNKDPLTMFVRFSALNAVTEVSFENY